MERKLLDRIMRVASEAYDADGILLDYYKHPDDDHGDGLAGFIVEEIKECSDTKECVIVALDKAVNELRRVRQAIYNNV